GGRGPLDDTLTIQRVYADGRHQPMRHARKSYRQTNKDFISANGRSVVRGGDGYIYVRDVTAENFSDAIIDAKDHVYLMNCTLENANRIIRVWSKAHVILVNCEVNLENGHEFIWLEDSQARLSYYNTTWNGRRDPDPARIGVHKGNSKSIISRNVKRLNYNPLDDVSPFFATSHDEISVQARVNGGGWRDVSPKGVGENGVGPVGDPRFAMPTLGNGTHEVRVRYSNNGRQGPLSDVLTYRVNKGRVDERSVKIVKGSANSGPVAPASNPAPPAPAAPTNTSSSSGASSSVSGSGDFIALKDHTSLFGLKANGDVGSLVSAKGGYGVRGGRYDQQADFLPKDGRNEAFLVDFNGPVRNVNLTLQMMSVRERGGLDESARWVALDANGRVVDQGALIAGAGQMVSSSTGRRRFSIKARSGFDALYVAPTAYRDGDGVTFYDNNSDFQFYAVTYSRQGGSGAARTAQRKVGDLDANAILLETAKELGGALARVPQDPEKAIVAYTQSPAAQPGAFADGDGF
ncbi:MAG: hypothetical protein AAGC56_11185, partial [Pseudomonadota bacterium]